MKDWYKKVESIGQQCTMDNLCASMREEMGELEEAIRDDSNINEELCDVINVAYMMLTKRVGDVPYDAMLAKLNFKDTKNDTY